MFENTGFISDSQAVKERSLIKNVYMWMSAGLALTAVVSLWMMSNPGMIVSMVQTGMFWGLVIGEFILVMFLSARIMSMSPSAAALSFAGYSLLNGITLSTIFLMYTGESIVSTFFITAATFAGMSLYAVTTKRNLAGYGHYLMMGLFGIIIASVVNIFLRSSGMSYLISYAGVLIFCGLTAYDTQAILGMSRNYSSSIGESDYMRFSIMGALKLYLDFINMFLFFLRIFGRRN